MLSLIRNKKIKLVFDTMTEGILITDVNGLVIHANSQAKTFFAEPKLVDKSILDIFHQFCQLEEKNLKRNVDLTNAINTNAVPFQFNVSSDILDEFRAYSVHILPIKEDSGIINSFIVTMDDITDITLEKLHRTQFVTMVGHELKHPLSSLKAYGYFLKKLLGDQPDKVLSYLQKYDEQINLLTKMLNDLSDISKITLRQFQVELKKMELGPLISRIVKDFQIIHPSRKISLTNHVNAVVAIDELRFRQVINNLISNAIKYSTSNTEVKVIVSISNEEVTVAVEDKGIGIAPDEISRIFEPYFRAQESKKKTKGLGLGLYIANQIIRKHHGKITIQSQPKQGSSFTIHLPLSH